MRIKSIGVIILILSGCGSMQKLSFREPTSEKNVKLIQVYQCGEIQYSEDNYVARDDDDLIYALRLDCNRDQKITPQDRNLNISISIDQIKPQQKAWLTRWKQAAVQAAKNAKANPYLCMQIQINEDPCVSGKNTFGFKPIFTSKVTNIQKGLED